MIVSLYNGHSERSIPDMLVPFDTFKSICIENWLWTCMYA